MKKQIICALVMVLLSAGLALGTEYVNDYYIGMPKDAVFYDEYSTIPEQDKAAAQARPEFMVQIGSIPGENGSSPIYGFVGKAGTIELYTDLQKDSFAYSARRDLTIPTGSETGFASLGETSYIDKLPDAAALKQAAGEEHYLPSGTEFIPGTPTPADIYASDADVTYEVVLRGAEKSSTAAVQTSAATQTTGTAAAQQAGTTATAQTDTPAAQQIQLLENGSVKLTESGAVSYWRYAFLTGATRGSFFPADENGNIIRGALPTDKLYIRCILTGTDTELEAEPQTEEAKAQKDALIAKHKEEREEAERKAREEAERKAKEEAERKAKEEAAKKAAAQAAKNNSSSQQSGKTSAEVAKTVEKNREAWTAELQKQTYYLEKNLERYLTYKAKNSSKSWAAVVQAVNCNLDRPFYTDIKSTDMSKGYLILVNKYYALKSSYTPKNLVSLSDKYTKNKGYRQLEKTTASAFMKMADAAKKDGITLVNVSPYRSYGTQNTLYNSYVNKNGKKAADTYSARPGHSEHQTGLALDINCASQSANFQNTKEYAWLIKNCYKYGFILRYPKGKEYITGYVYEPWHYRYVGVEVATEIHKLGITFEEYYAYFIDK